MYIHEHPDWPNLRWEQEGLAEKLAATRHRQGRLFGGMEALGFDLRQKALLLTFTEDVTESSGIEGEKLDKRQVRSSVARRLGLDVGGLERADRDVEGIVEMTLDATRRCREPLTAERLRGWHSAMFPTGRSGIDRIIVGRWRGASGDPMQVVSGPYGRERVHFEAPSAQRLDEEMRAFLDWFEAPSGTDHVIRAGLAHLRFVTIHPFEDGNGRIARAIADMALARSEGSPDRFYSMSSQIRQERADYYDVLERTQKGTPDVSEFLDWFLSCLDRAIEKAQVTLDAALSRARFWERAAALSLNERQHLVVNRLLDGFEGKLTSSKWAKLAKCSQDTALRDITGLIERGVLVRGAQGGRSASYDLAVAE